MISAIQNKYEKKNYKVMFIVHCSLFAVICSENDNFDFMKRKLQCNRNCYRNRSLNSLNHSFAFMKIKNKTKIDDYTLLLSTNDLFIASSFLTFEMCTIVVEHWNNEHNTKTIIKMKQKKMKASLVMYPK